MPEIYLDLVQKRNYRKTFEPEQALEILFPRESSLPRIICNTAATTLLAGLWARGWQQFKSLTPGFTIRYIRNGFSFSTLFFLSNEIMYSLFPKHFNSQNLFLQNSASLIVAISFSSLFRASMFSQNKGLLLKYGIHIFLYSLYFDLAVAGFRNTLLCRKSSIIEPDKSTKEENFERIMESNKKLERSFVG